MKTLITLILVAAGFSVSQPVQASAQKRCEFIGGLVTAHQVVRQQNGSLADERQSVINDSELTPQQKSFFLSIIRITEQYPFQEDAIDVGMSYLRMCLRNADLMN